MYVPTLGPLAQNLTHVSRYQTGADALRSADRLAERGQTDQAAAMYRVAIHVAEVLAEAITPSNTRLARGWRATAMIVADRARGFDISL